MKIVALIARILLGLTFFVFGLNGLFHFLPPPPTMTGLRGQFIGAMMESHYIVVVAAVQAIAGGLLLINRFVPLALTLLGPILVNILAYHFTMDPSGVGPGGIATFLWALLVWRLRQYFAPLFTQRAVPMEKVEEVPAQ